MDLPQLFSIDRQFPFSWASSSDANWFCHQSFFSWACVASFLSICFSKRFFIFMLTPQRVVVWSQSENRCSRALNVCQSGCAIVARMFFRERDTRVAAYIMFHPHIRYHHNLDMSQSLSQLVIHSQSVSIYVIKRIYLHITLSVACCINVAACILWRLILRTH